MINFEMAREEYDLIVVGAGPAGLSAALTASYFKLKTLVIESCHAGGALMNQYPWKIVENYLGFKNMEGAEVAERMVEHVKSEGAMIVENENVTEIERRGESITVRTDKNNYQTKSVIIAIGHSIPRKLEIDGENLKGVIYSVPKPREFKGKEILVVGGGDTALECALALHKNRVKVTIAHRRDTFRASDENVQKVKNVGIEILWNTEVRTIEGNERVESVELINNETNETTKRKFEVVVPCIGTRSNADFLKSLGVMLDDRDNIVINEKAMTSVEGIFAAGDVVGRWKRIPEAIGEGGYAAINAFKYVKKPYWR